MTLRYLVNVFTPVSKVLRSNRVVNSWDGLFPNLGNHHPVWTFTKHPNNYLENSPHLALCVSERSISQYSTNDVLSLEDCVVHLCV